MTPDDIRAHEARALSPSERDAYFEDGATLVENAVGADWLDRMNAAVARLFERARTLTASDDVFDLEPSHSSENPRLRRNTSPCDQDPVFWEVLTDGPLGDIAVDLLGPDVKFHQAKLNFKSPGGGTEVRWHQDQPFFPHTNHAVLTMGVYLQDCTPEQGPLEIIPGSHRGDIYSHYDDAGQWRGEIGDRDAAAIDVASARMLAGPAGSLTAHNYRTVHGSKPNRSDQPRPLLLYVLSAADAMRYTSQPLKSRYDGQIVRGSEAREAHHEPGRYRLPPDWSGGYSSIFALQQREQRTAAAG